MNEEKGFSKGNKYEIFIGLKDKDSYEEILTAIKEKTFSSIEKVFSKKIRELTNLSDDYDYVY